MLNSLFDKAKQIFTQPEDQAVLRQQEDILGELEAIDQLSMTDGGKALKKWIIGQISATVYKLIETREKDLISDLKSYIELFNKLNVSSDIDAIRAWLEEKINE